MARKLIGDKIVRDVAYRLICRNGNTTTLDIKNELRDRGYWAQQGEVSSLMNEIYDKEGWDFTTNGMHRIYFIINDVGPHDDEDDDEDDGDPWWDIEEDDDQVSLQGGGGIAGDDVSQGGDDVSDGVVLDGKVSGRWECYNGKDTRKEYMDGSMSRSRARWEYHKIVGMPYNIVRARRVE